MNSKFLVANAVNQQLSRQTLLTDESKNKFSLKSWHWAFLLGLPSATLLSYLIYKRYYLNAKTKNERDKTHKSTSKTEPTETQQDTTKKEPAPRPKVKLFNSCCRRSNFN
jgi:hypothetical protein